MAEIGPLQGETRPYSPYVAEIGPLQGETRPYSPYVAETGLVHVRNILHFTEFEHEIRIFSVPPS